MQFSSLHLGIHPSPGFLHVAFAQPALQDP